GRASGTMKENKSASGAPPRDQPSAATVKSTDVLELTVSPYTLAGAVASPASSRSSKVSPDTLAIRKVPAASSRNLSKPRYGIVAGVVSGTTTFVHASKR